MTTLPSIREQILVHLMERFKQVVKNIDGHSVTWSSVYRSPIPSSEITRNSVISIIEEGETKRPRISVMDCDLTISTEFWYKMKLGDVPSMEANRLLSDIQLTMRSDISCNNLAYNLVEISNSIDIDSMTDRLINGVITWVISYRHNVDNPTLKK
jgi:hypothetical protein